MFVNETEESIGHSNYRRWLQKRNVVFGATILNLKLENYAHYVGLLKFSAVGLEYIMEVMKKPYADYEDRPWKQSVKTVRKAYMTGFLNAIIESGKIVQVVKFENGRIEFDTNEGYENACSWAEDGCIGKFIRLDGIDFPY